MVAVFPETTLKSCPVDRENKELADMETCGAVAEMELAWKTTWLLEVKAKLPCAFISTSPFVEERESRFAPIAEKLAERALMAAFREPTKIFFPAPAESAAIAIFPPPETTLTIP
jgi:hypothetical protein